MIRSLYRYPVKGLSGENLNSFELQEHVGLSFDRIFAIVRKAGAFDRHEPKALPKIKFLMLMRDEALAQLSTHYDQFSHRLSIKKGDDVLLTASLNESDGCKRLAEFFKDFLNDEKIEPELVFAEDHRFTDISVVSKEKMNAVSLINLDSVEDLAAAIERPVHPLRFRSNIYFEGVEPWSELDWVDKEIHIGGARLKVSMRTKRCAATQVNPDSGVRDIDIPGEIRRHRGHFDMGVYAEVIGSGSVSVGDSIVY